MILREKVVRIVDMRQEIYENCTAEINSRTMADQDRVRYSGSNEKSIFDHDRLIGLQKLIFRSNHRFLILYDQSFH